MRRFAFVVTLILSLAQPVPLAAETSPLSGDWLGVLTVQGLKLRLVLHVSRTGEGTYTATLDSIDQGAKGLAVDEISESEGEVHFTARRLGLTYRGMLVADGKRVEGEMQQGGATLPLTFERAESVPDLRRPQDPVAPYPYAVHEVTYRNVEDGVTLAGTLTVPRSEGPHPAVVLITGSGAQDRDETFAGHRPFLILADDLTRRGIAVLRSDDRGVGGSGGGSPRDTTATFARDVLAAVAFLKARADIDAGRIGLIGHSEGGAIAAIAAARSDEIRFVVMLGGLGQKGEEVIVSQTRLMQETIGLPDKVIQATSSTLRNVFTALRSEPDPVKAQTKMESALATQRASLPAETRADFDQVHDTLLSQLRMYTSAWFRYFLDYDPRTHLRQLRVPVLALTGELDLQAPAKENLAGIEKAIRAGGNRDVTVRELTGLNHLLQTAGSGLPNEYSTIEETIAPSALEAIGTWVEERVRAGESADDRLPLPHPSGD